MKKGNAIALLPIGVFLCIYLGLGILFEYVMKIPMGFYNVPIIIAFLAAILVACLQNRKVRPNLLGRLVSLQSRLLLGCGRPERSIAFAFVPTLPTRDPNSNLTTILFSCGINFN